MKSKVRVQKREFWADAMRALSIFLVVVIHSSAKVLYDWGNVLELSWNFANLLNSFSRISVPLFVMISGAFLLNKNEGLLDFIKKRIPRIIIPWFCWGTLQLLYTYDFSLNAILNNNIFSKLAATYFGGFWFMPMILGLYLITPIIKGFTKKATKQEYLYFFVIWFFFASLIPTLNTSFGINISYQLPLFIQYLGYFVAGYYLVHKTKRYKFKMAQIDTLFIVSSLVITLGTYALTKNNLEFNASLYEYLNIPVLITSITGFISLKSILKNKTFISSKIIRNKITKISQASFGIFLSHSLILEIFSRGYLGVTIHGLITNPFISLPITIISVFSTATLIIIGLQKVTKNLFG
jgi:surface polysaccharide O-acyltransferase-like enzyme